MRLRSNILQKIDVDFGRFDENLERFLGKYFTKKDDKSGRSWRRLQTENSKKKGLGSILVMAASA